MDSVLEILPPFGPLDPIEVPNKIHREKTLLYEHLTRQHKLLLSGGVAASVTSSIYNSLDCLRVRWQTLPQTPKHQEISSRGMLHFTRYIIQNEGFVNGLCRPGLFTSMTASGISASLRFGFYENIRDAICPTHEEKNAIHMFVAGFSCGAVGYFLTTPLQILKTKIQANTNNALHSMADRGKVGGNMTLHYVTRIDAFAGLWNGGFTVAARGALFTAGQMLGYDGFKTFCKNQGIIEDGIRLHVASSIVAAFVSSALSAPADFIFARYVSLSSSSSSSSQSSKSLMHCMKTIYHQDGVLGFWRGFGISFLRLCPVMLSYSMIYEQLRRHFGLGYLT